MHEQEGKEEIHLHIEVDHDVAPITMRMPQCYIRKYNDNMSTKYFVGNDDYKSNKITLLVDYDDDDVIMSDDKETDMDGEEDINDDCIPLNEEGFEFVNVDEDEWIDNVQADANVDGASSSENELSNNSDEEDIKIGKYRSMSIVLLVRKIRLTLMARFHDRYAHAIS
ncbi:hypothetical protein POTOM_021455 [Populus tomentosa]|uniref:Uncharacterized protein n=1 Tax=Populus tomentosa TaxID=118781 RepID=A0A8X7ZR71_POPTO|nr:hypothetical protein POTOM_021455 [Populus tomentosa]